MSSDRVRLATLTAQFAPKIEEIGREAWDDAFDAPEFDLLRALERQPRRPERYAILYDGDRSVARLLISSIDHSPSRLQRVLGRAALLVTGPSGGLAFRLARGIDPVAAGPAVGDALRALARRERRAVVLTVPTAERETEALRRAGFAISPAPSTMTMTLPSTYEAYTKRLSQRHRKDLRRLKRRAEEAGHRFGRHEDWPFSDAELFDLFSETMARHGLVGDSLPYDASHLPGLKAIWGPDLHLFTATKDGRLLAFLAVHATGTHVRVTVPGIRDAEARPYALYLLLWQEVLAWSIERGFATIDAGTQMVRAKARMGFSERPLHYAYATVSTRLDAALALAKPWLERHVLAADLDQAEEPPAANDAQDARA